MSGFPRPLNDKFIKYFKKLILDIVEFESWFCDPNKTYLATLLGLGNAACLANHGFSLFLLAHSLKCFFYLGPVFAPLLSSWSNRPNPPARQVTASPPDPWESMYNTREDLVDNVTSRTDIAKGRTDILTKGSCDTHHTIKALNVALNILKVHFSFPFIRFSPLFQVQTIILLISTTPHIHYSKHILFTVEFTYWLSDVLRKKEKENLLFCWLFPQTLTIAHPWIGAQPMRASSEGKHSTRAHHFPNWDKKTVYFRPI